MVSLHCKTLVWLLQLANSSRCVFRIPQQDNDQGLWFTQEGYLRSCRYHFLSGYHPGLCVGAVWVSWPMPSLISLSSSSFKQALAQQPSAETLSFPAVQAAGIALFVGGQILVLTSIFALGVTGTYLGDYFGILMSERVTGFPFNLMENPMYNGSTMCFIGTAIWYQKPAGLIISAIVFVVYQIALAYEGYVMGAI